MHNLMMVTTIIVQQTAEHTNRLRRRRERPLEDVALLVDVLAVVGVLLAPAADD